MGIRSRDSSRNLMKEYENHLLMKQAMISNHCDHRRGKFMKVQVRYF